jgi:hypothetical protein
VCGNGGGAAEAGQQLAAGRGDVHAIATDEEGGDLGLRLGLSVADDLCRADLLMPVSGVATAIDCYHEHA